MTYGTERTLCLSGAPRDTNPLHLGHAGSRGELQEEGLEVPKPYYSIYILLYELLTELINLAPSACFSPKVCRD